MHTYPITAVPSLMSVIMSRAPAIIFKKICHHKSNDSIRSKFAKSTTFRECYISKLKYLYVDCEKTF